MEYGNTKDGMLTFKEYKKGLEVVSYEGEDIYLDIPAAVESGAGQEATERRPVIAIGKKAFLSCKSLRRVSLPETMEEVGDWAFAYCDELREVQMPEKGIRFGRGIFRECGKLCLVTVAGKPRDIGTLLAAAVTLLNAPYLFAPLRCGDEDWLRQWDACMLQILRAEDMEGFFKMGLWGEEDCSCKENDLDYFLNQKRKSKVRIAFLRLLHPSGLRDEVRKELEHYLRVHTAGSGASDEAADSVAAGNASEADGGYRDGASPEKKTPAALGETWQVLSKEHGEDAEYYQLFTETGCLTAENFDRILLEAGEDYPEMKAWFLKYKDEEIGYTDFFADLEI